ncbi:hypothetical protein GCM10025865_16220 [Paraoerskovia sediminicola]|uniref:Endonuclease/exonuclease/phosphatase domain-containing protein n=1 Tax=Paraoerskovia sediminicola TaxID=1138587 RepID=A0ABM8G2I0_9CELL|nr:endonuclease/exonuclease/phosphatase family protein [Paraoerskovia sediminicola]BDZ42323.1 hypothetical protein GCM10025865_16220 [Paraoerskovia sediminicola]
MRIATFNVQHGRASDDASPDALGATRTTDASLARFEDAVAALDADVLALQEVEVGRRRSAGADLTLIAARATGAVAHRFVPTVRYRSLTGHESAYGIAIVSRLPVSEWHELHMPGLRLPRLRRTRRPPGLRVVGEEPRAAVAAVVASDDGPVTVVATHLSVRSPRNTDQLHVIHAWAARFPRPLVLAGDLNLRPGSPERITGWRSLAEAPTYPVTRPRAQIDHLLADGPITAGRAGRAPRTGVSDHRPLVAEVRIG